MMICLVDAEATNNAMTLNKGETLTLEYEIDIGPFFRGLVEQRIKSLVRQRIPNAGFIVRTSTLKIEIKVMQ